MWCVCVWIEGGRWVGVHVRACMCMHVCVRVRARACVFPNQYNAEDCASIPIGHRRPSTWEMDKPFELTVTPTNVDTLLISARFYNQSDVIGLCKDLLMDCDPGNCLYNK